VLGPARRAASHITTVTRSYALDENVPR
jgi:hypothetical protein